MTNNIDVLKGKELEPVVITNPPEEPIISPAEEAAAGTMLMAETSPEPREREDGTDEILDEIRNGRAGGTFSRIRRRSEDFDEFLGKRFNFQKITDALSDTGNYFIFIEELEKGDGIFKDEAFSNVFDNEMAMELVLRGDDLLLFENLGAFHDLDLKSLEKEGGRFFSSRYGRAKDELESRRAMLALAKREEEKRERLWEQDRPEREKREAQDKLHREEIVRIKKEKEEVDTKERLAREKEERRAAEEKRLAEEEAARLKREEAARLWREGAPARQAKEDARKDRIARYERGHAYTDGLAADHLRARKKADGYNEEDVDNPNYDPYSGGIFAGKFRSR